MRLLQTFLTASHDRVLPGELTATNRQHSHPHHQPQERCDVSAEVFVTGVTGPLPLPLPLP